MAPATGSSITSSSFSISGNNPVLILNIAASTTTESVSSVSWSLGSKAPYEVSTVRTSDDYISVWAIPAPTQGSGTYTVRFTNSVPYQIDGQVFLGVDQQNPSTTADAVTAAGGGTSTITLTPTNLASNDAVVGVGANTVASNPTGITPNDTYHNATTAVNLQSGYRLGSGSVVANWDTGSGVHAMVAIRLVSVNGGGLSSTLPQFSLVSSDAESDDMEYKILLYDSDCSSAPPPYGSVQTFDQTSSQVGWSQQDEISSNVAGKTAGYETGVKGNTLSTSDAGNANPFDLVEVGAGPGTIVYDDTHVHGGTLAQKSSVGGSSGQADAGWTTSLGSLTDHYGRFYMYLSADPPADNQLVWMGNSGSQVARIWINTTGHIYTDATGGSGGSGPMAAAVALNQWVRVEYHVFNNASTGIIEVKLFNSAESTTPTETTTATAQNTQTLTNQILFGWNKTGTNLPKLWIDDTVAGPSITQGRLLFSL